MNNANNLYSSKSLSQLVNTTASVTGTILDLAGFVNVGKRAVKLITAVADCKSTSSTTTDQVVSVTWYESDSTSSTDGTAITNAALSASTASGVTEYNVLVSKRYVFATASAGGTTPAWGVIAVALPTLRNA